ncbi:uncharacterized protein VICG_01450 [Vittaforma corneae ATCC 50505]|uniref:Uncharacterized protein n=1 Tax=Vittaforma corneae (strain ATCC 50505) TaxID=993615 RepID=L2GKT4_VITCO|nr:uncharacterized protein VICG_01450 [Vittaforma corneae ATCC 50505]ELA41466.1 hypothetical protein VICG_01450 [Vittaforma corneae ATCC 50505]
MNKADFNLLEKIKTVLLSKKIQPIPENIANACFETVIELYNRNKRDFKELLDVAVQMKAYTLNRTFLQAISLCIPLHPSPCCTILHSVFQENSQTWNSVNSLCENSELYQLFQILLKNIEIKRVSNFIVKHFRVSDCFDTCDFEKQVIILENSMDVFMDDFDVMHFIVSNRSALDSATLSRLLLSFLRAKYTKDSFVDIDVLKSIIYLMAPFSPENLEILTLTLAFYRKNINKLKLMGGTELGSIFTTKLIDLITHEVVESKNSENDLIDLFSLLSDHILPAFSSILININEKFLQEKKYQKLLQNMISYIKIQDFVDVVGSVDISKHFLVFKGLSNVDLGVFFGLYRVYSRSTEYESIEIDYSKSEPLSCITSSSQSDSLGCLMACLPSFCYYCTDYLKNHTNLMKIFKVHINTHPTIVCSALEKLVYSHTENLTNTLQLNNPISKEESILILSSVKECGIVYDLIDKHIQNDTLDCEVVLQMLIKLCNVDLSHRIIPVILDDVQDQALSLYDALRLMIFFVDRNTFDLDFISRLLELCSFQAVPIQKKSYQLLYKIYSQKRTSVCICDILYSSLIKTMNLAAEKNRILLLHSILKNGCLGCKVENKAEMVDKFLSEIIKGLFVGNYKCKKVAKEIIIQMIDDQYFLKFLLDHMSDKSNDVPLICGCINAAQIVLEYTSSNTEYIYSHNNDINRDFVVNSLLNALIFVSMHSQDVAKHILKAFNLIILNSKYTFFYNEMAKVVDSYISQFPKKLRSELREFCISAQTKGFSLSKSMKTMLKFKNKGGKSKNIVIVNKPEFNELL